MFIYNAEFGSLGGNYLFTMRSFVNYFVAVAMMLPSLSYADTENHFCGKNGGHNLIWEYLEPDILKITGYGEMEDYEEDPYWDWHPYSTAPWHRLRYFSVDISDGVTSIGNWAFAYNVYGEGDENEEVIKSFTTIDIPNSVSRIGSFAFWYCSYLRNVKFPSSLITIEDWAFAECWDLQSIELPSNLSTLGVGAFEGCNSLKHVSWGSSLERIQSSTFGYCYELKSIVIPNSVLTIDSHAFENSGLDSIFISNSVKEIGIYTTEDNGDEVAPYTLTDDENGVSPFIGCRDLKSIIVDESNPIYDSRDNCNAIIKTEKNLLLFGCSGTIIPNTVTSIGQRAFCDMGIKAMTIPASVNYIGSSAFRNNPLVEIHCQGTIPPSCFGAFDDESYYDCTIYVPRGCKEVYESSDWGWFYNIVEEDVNVITTIKSPDTKFSISDGLIQLTFNGAYTGKVDINIYDLTGNPCHSTQYCLNSSQSETIDAKANLQKGKIYFVNIITSNEILNYRFIY